jgi:hypothetical protein
LLKVLGPKFEQIGQVKAFAQILGYFDGGLGQLRQTLQCGSRA